MTLPPPSWGNVLAGRIQGLTLITLALAVLLTALGKFDNALTLQQKQDILHGFYLLGLINEPAPIPLKPPGEQISVNYDQGPQGATAVLSIPNNVYLINYRARADSGPNRNAGYKAPVPSDPDKNGIITLRSDGTAGGSGGGNSGVTWHIEADVVPKYQPLNITTLGKFVFGGAFLLAILSVIFRPRAAKDQQATRDDLSTQ